MTAGTSAYAARPNRAGPWPSAAAWADIDNLAYKRQASPAPIEQRRCERVHQTVGMMRNLRHGGSDIVFALNLRNSSEGGKPAPGAR